MLFFFSSRRRHTRWTGDWSSDVCSSDLSAERVSTRPARPAIRLRLLWRIEPAEVLQHEPPLLGAEPRELLPRGIAELRARAGGARLQDLGNVDAVAGRGAAHALLLLVGLLALQGPARVQQPAVQLLLAPDRLLIEASGLELARQLAGFLGERRSRGARPLRLEALELLGEGALAGGEGPQLLEHRLTARADQREQPLRLAVQPLLIARQPRELLHGFGEPAPRLRAAHLTAAAGQRERRGIQGVHRLLRQPRGLSGTHVRLLELRLRRRHLPFREAERPFELGGNERVLPSGLADLAAHGVGALLDRCLLRAGRRARLAAAQRFGHSLLALRQRGRRGAVGPRRVVAVPLALPALQVLRVGSEGGERPLHRRAPEQLLAALQLGLELLLRFGEPLERLARGLGIELR